MSTRTISITRIALVLLGTVAGVATPAESRALDLEFRRHSMEVPLYEATGWDVWPLVPPIWTLPGSLAPATTELTTAFAFDSGDWTTHTMAHSYHSTHGKSEGFRMVSFGGCHHGTTRTVFCLDIAATQFDGVEESGAGGLGVIPSLQFHYYRSGRFAAFVEGAFGVLTSKGRVPDEGTEFNFTEQAGLGIQFELWQGTYFRLAGRYVHISNASIPAGSKRNPGVDSIGVVAGFDLRL